MIEFFGNKQGRKANEFTGGIYTAALAERKITTCILPKTNRKIPIPHDVGLYHQ